MKGLAGKKEEGSPKQSLATGPEGLRAPASLLELQLQALEHGVRVAVPAAGLSLSSSVLRDFVAFLESFLLNDYQPVQIHLTEPSKKEGNFIFSQTAQALFSRVPGNAKATPPIWTAPKPSQVQLVGSCGAELGPPAFARNLDLAFELPADALDKRDYLNYRYLAKRAGLVDAVHSQLLATLASPELPQKWKWASVCRDRLKVEASVLPWRFDNAKTFISLRFLPVAAEAAKLPAAADAAASGDEETKDRDRAIRQLQKWEVRLFPAYCSSVFREKFLRPDANAVRRRTTATRGVPNSNTAEAHLTEAQVKTLPPTPYYNGLVLEDSRLFRHARILRKCAKDFPAFASSVLLFKAWAKRRALLASGAFNSSLPSGACCGFTLSLILAHACLASADVARVATPLQLFKLALSFIGRADFHGHFYCIGEEAGHPKTALPGAAAAVLAAAVAARNDAADAANPASAAAAADQQQLVQIPQWGRSELCVGLVENAFLFDSEEKTFNILWRAQLHIQELQQEAQISLTTLETLEDPFLPLFGEQQEQLLLKSDLWVQIPSLPPRGNAYDLEASFPVANYEPPQPDQRHISQGPPHEDACIDDPIHIDPPKWEACPAFLGAGTVARLLVRGLGNRLQTFRIRFSLAGSPTGASREGNVADACPVGLLVSITLNGKAYSRLLDRGPPLVDSTESASGTPNAIAADSFRKFWGPRCDVRRFQDGRMLHCVLWEKFVALEGPAALERGAERAVGTQSPPEQITRAVLERHAAGICEYSATLTKTEPSATPKRQRHRRAFSILCSPLGSNGPLSERQKALIRAFAELKNVLCALSSTPLTIKQVWHSDAALRHTEVSTSNIWETESADAMSKQKPQQAATVHSVVVQFEDSGKWPVEREAVCKLKAAFLVAMNEELLRDYSVSSNVMESYLDVHFQSFIFRVQIFHPNEVMEEANIFTDFSLKPIISHLGKAVVGSGGNGKETLTFLGALPDDQTTAKQVCDVLLQEDVALLSAINPYHKDQVLHLRSLWWAPQASALLHSLALKHTAFAGAVRLAVLWLSKQLVVGAVHFVEHVMAFLFVDYLRAGYGDEPQTPHVAFLRFLQFVSSFDWEHNALLVSFDPAAPLTEEQRQKMQISFEHFRHTPSVHSVIDPHGFILPRPNPPSFRRLIGCARDCFKKIHVSCITSAQLTVAWAGLFTTDWCQFDIILRLKDPLATSEARPDVTAPQKKRRFANLAFNRDPEDHRREPITCGLLQRGGSEDLSVYFPRGKFNLSPTAPETAAVLDDLLLRAVGSKVCIRRYILLRFLRRLFQAFPNAFVLGLDFVQAQQLGGGLPDAIALKIPPVTLLCRAVQPLEVLPRLLVCPSWEAQKVPRIPNNPKKEDGDTLQNERAFMAVLSPAMLLGGINAIAVGLVESVLLT